jgi:hypothetical protein
MVLRTSVDAARLMVWAGPEASPDLGAVTSSAVGNQSLWTPSSLWLLPRHFSLNWGMALSERPWCTASCVIKILRGPRCKRVGMTRSGACSRYRKARPSERHDCADASRYCRCA